MTMRKLMDFPHARRALVAVASVDFRLPPAARLEILGHHACGACSSSPRCSLGPGPAGRRPTLCCGRADRPSTSRKPKPRRRRRDWRFPSRSSWDRPPCCARAVARDAAERGTTVRRLSGAALRMPPGAVLLRQVSRRWPDPPARRRGTCWRARSGARRRRASCGDVLRSAQADGALWLLAIAFTCRRADVGPRSTSWPAAFSHRGWSESNRLERRPASICPVVAGLDSSCCAPAIRLPSCFGEVMSLGLLARISCATAPTRPG